MLVAISGGHLVPPPFTKISATSTIHTPSTWPLPARPRKLSSFGCSPTRRFVSLVVAEAFVDETLLRRAPSGHSLTKILSSGRPRPFPDPRGAGMRSVSTRRPWRLSRTACTRIRNAAARPARAGRAATSRQRRRRAPGPAGDPTTGFPTRPIPCTASSPSLLFSFASAQYSLWLVGIPS